MRPFFVPGCKMLNPVTAFNGFVVVSEPGVFHCFAFCNKQANQRVLWNGSNFAFGFPIALRVPLACCTCTHQLPSEYLQQYPIREATAIKKPGACATRKPLAPGTTARAIIVFAFRFDCRVLYAIPCPSVCRGAILTTCAEDIRPTDTQQSNLPSNPLQRVAALFQFLNLVCNIICTIHARTSFLMRSKHDRGGVTAAPCFSVIPCSHMGQTCRHSGIIAPHITQRFSFMICRLFVI